MNQQEIKKFENLCQLVIDSLEKYFPQSRIKKLWFKLKKNHAAIIKYLQKAVFSLSLDHLEQQEYQQALIRLLLELDQHRYFLATHTLSRHARYIIQDAMIQIFLHQAQNTEKMNEELQKFIEHYRNRRGTFGRSIKDLQRIDIVLAARAAYIHGKLTEILSIEKIISVNLKRIKRELKFLLSAHIYKGYLNKERLEADISKIDNLLNLLKNPSEDFALEEILLQSRYLLEHIVSACGVETSGIALHHEHAILLNSCDWIDEVFQAVRGKLEIFY